MLIFAAASLKPALDALLSMPEVQRTHDKLRVSYAASSLLARQIEHGAPASVFVSADRDWMDYLEKRGLIVNTSRVDLLGNALVLIAPASSAVKLDLMPGVDFEQALGIDGRLAIAEPESVPAGRYAKAALDSLGLWTEIETRTVHAGDVRAALNFVARGEAALGIVYRSDAISTPAVRIVDTFASDLHPPIIYPVALIKQQDSQAAYRAMRLLQSDAARVTFRRFGFELPSPDTEEFDHWTH